MTQVALSERCCASNAVPHPNLPRGVNVLDWDFTLPAGKMREKVCALSFYSLPANPLPSPPRWRGNARGRSSVAASDNLVHLSNRGGRSCVSVSEIQMRAEFYSLSAPLPNPLPKEEMFYTCHTKKPEIISGNF